MVDIRIQSDDLVVLIDALRHYYELLDAFDRGGEHVAESARMNQIADEFKDRLRVEFTKSL